MSRKKKPPQAKRQQVTDSSGWTHIIRGPKAEMTSISRLTTERSETSLTVEAYTEKFWTKYNDQWQQSACLHTLEVMLFHFMDQGIGGSAKVSLTKCVCLGLGSLTVGLPSSSFELAALRSILECLGTLLTHHSPGTLE